MRKKISVLPGDGIGPEIMAATLQVLTRLQSTLQNIPESQGNKIANEIEINEYPVGGHAIDQCGEALPPETIKGCEQADAILFGSIGGPKWEHLPAEKQPERAALLPIRKHFNLFANLRPIRTYPTLLHHSPVRLEQGTDAKAKTDGKEKTDEVNILIVRELTGGIYFADPKGGGGSDDMEYAFDTMRYHRFEIERIARLAFAIASQRKMKTVHSIDKANVLHSMAFWRKIIREMHQSDSQNTHAKEISLQHMYVDNAAMQLILHPRQFDVLLCPNLFGDILSDEASVLSGSLGLLPSASLSATVSHRKDTTSNSSASIKSNGGQNADPALDLGYRFGLYEPAGGSAPDIAGKNVANPIAQILSLALLLRFSFQWNEAATLLETAVEQVLADGAVTQDIADAGQSAISCQEMAEEIGRKLL